MKNIVKHWWWARIQRFLRPGSLLPSRNQTRISMENSHHNGSLISWETHLSIGICLFFVLLLGYPPFVFCWFVAFPDLIGSQTVAWFQVSAHFEAPLDDPDTGLDCSYFEVHFLGGEVRVMRFDVYLYRRNIRFWASIGVYSVGVFESIWFISISVW